MKPDNRKRHEAALQVMEDNWRAEKKAHGFTASWAERDEMRKAILLGLAEAEENAEKEFSLVLRMGGRC
jgi:hypothetical protein